MKIKTKLIASSLAIALAAAGVSVGATYALFTSNSKADVAVTAGKVKLTSEANTDSLAVYSASLTQTIIDGDELAGTKEIDAADERWDEAQYASQKAYQATYYYERQTAAYSGADGTGYYFKTNGHAAINADKNYVTLSKMAGGDRVLFNVDVKNESNINIKYRLRFALNEDPSLYDDVHTLADAQAFATALSYVWGDQSYSKWHEWSAESVVRTKTLWFDFELPILTGDAYQDKLAYFTFTVEAVQANAYTSDPVEPMEIDKKVVEDATKPTQLSTDTAEVKVPANTVQAGTELHLEVEPGIDGGVKVEPAAGQGTQIYEVTVVDQTGAKVETPTGTFFECSLYIGVVELYNFYHNGQLMTKKDTKAEVVGLGQYYYDAAAGTIYFLTDSFSPFQAIYKFDGGLGTEEYPYLVNGLNTWMSLVDLTKNDNTYSVTNGVYFNVTEDIDVSGIGSRATIHYFGGHIDFKGHKVSGYNGNNTVESDIGDDGLDAIFTRVGGTVTIKNLNFYSSQLNRGSKITLMQVVGRNSGVVDLSFEGVNTYGKATGATGNNNAPFYAYSFGADGTVSLKNCNNYATIIGSGAKSAFVGNLTYTTTSVSFNNCHNYGTIICTNKYGAGMLIGNGSNYGDAKTINIVNCSNLGVIASNNEAKLDIGFHGDGKPNIIVNGEVTGNPASIFTGGALGTQDNKFVLNPVADAVKYELQFAFSAGGKYFGGCTGYTLVITEEQRATADIMVGNWINKADAQGTIVAHNEYVNTYYTCGGSYVFNEDNANIREPIDVMYIAYDANGNVLGISTYTYPSAN